MTISLNRVFIMGHLGADPDIHTTEAGRQVAKLSVATNETFLKDGEKQERTEWHRVVIFHAPLITNVVIPFLKTGSPVLIEGSLRTDKYTDKEGVERYSTDIILEKLQMLDTKPKED